MEVSSRNLDFLGREFLTWLWFKSEERNGSVLLPGLGDIEIIFLRRLVFESGEGDYSETVVCQGFTSNLKEGKAALREGKKIKEARIRLGVGENEWQFTFKADNFKFQSMTLPLSLDFPEEEKDTEARFIDRMGMVDTALRTMERLFSFFLTERISSRWHSEELPRYRHWMSEKA